MAYLNKILKNNKNLSYGVENKKSVKERDMGNFKEYDQYDGLGLAELIRKKEISAEEVCNEAIDRIERLNPQLNAVILKMFDTARETLKAGLPEGPFRGVPFLVKDLQAALAGVPLTHGCKGYRNAVPDHDCELVRRWKNTGLVVLGKTNTPEFGLMNTTEPELFGATRNPWNLERTPGGSSGGSAAAVAAAMVPLASGGDGGGSLRIPSSFCGLFGLKPSRGRNPTGPDYGEIWQGAVVDHVITRSVRDSAAMLDATCGADVGAPYVIAPPQNSYLAETETAPGRLKIAFNAESPLLKPIDPEFKKAVYETALMLTRLGHDVEEAKPDLDGRVLARSYLTLYYGEVAADIHEMEQILGREAGREDVELMTWFLGRMGESTSAPTFLLTRREWGKAARSMGRFHQTYDLYLTPTVAHPPIRIGQLQLKAIEQTVFKLIDRLHLWGLLHRSGMPIKMGIQRLSRTPFTQLANFTGQPAMSVPLHWTAEGLPCGMQFMARFGDEATLFRLAAQLEKEKPWFDQRPPMAAGNVG
jgi:amidase